MAARKQLKHDDKTKDNIKASQLLNLLNEIGNHGTCHGVAISKDEQTVRVAAIKAALPFLRPTLSSVEQTLIDPAANLDESQIRSSIKGMLLNHGPLVAELLAEVARERQEPVRSSDAAQQTG